jgi:maleylacetoacetate isomerase
MRLYTFWRSSAAYRVRIALNLKGLPFQSVPKKFKGAEHRQPDYLAVNPQGLIPALDHAGQILSQSLAIIEYLDEIQRDPPLLPPNALDRARVRSLAQAIACDIHPLNNLRVLQYLKAPLGHDQEVVNDWVRHWIAAGFSGLEVQARSYSAAARYLFGDTITLADLCLVPQMYNARRFECDLSPYPTLLSICAALDEHPAFVRARPEAQPDAE